MIVIVGINYILMVFKVYFIVYNFIVGEILGFYGDFIIVY